MARLQPAPSSPQPYAFASSKAWALLHESKPVHFLRNLFMFKRIALCAAFCMSCSAHGASLRMDVHQGADMNQLAPTLSCVAEVNEASDTPMRPASPHASDDDKIDCARFTVFAREAKAPIYELRGQLKKMINVDQVAGLRFPAMQTIELDARPNFSATSRFEMPFDTERMDQFSSRPSRSDDQPMKRFGMVVVTLQP
jgi:hypothetical protein